jgi:hypothetical protein
MTQLSSSSSRFAVDSGKDGELIDGDVGVSGCPDDEDSGILGCSVEEMEIQPARLNKIATAATVLRHH